MLADKMCLDSTGMLDEKSLARLHEHFNDEPDSRIGFVLLDRERIPEVQQRV